MYEALSEKQDAGVRLFLTFTFLLMKQARRPENDSTRSENKNGNSSSEEEPRESITH